MIEEQGHLDIEPSLTERVDAITKQMMDRIVTEEDDAPNDGDDDKD